MLLRFAFENVFSFAEATEWSAVQTSLKERLFDDVQHSSPLGKERVLRASVLYGANASGKTNWMRVWKFFAHTVLEFDSLEEALDHAPRFALDAAGAGKRIRFEVEFVWHSVRYRYGWCAEASGYLEEWLFEKKTREVPVFERRGEHVVAARSRVGLQQIVQNNLLPAGGLLVGLGAQFNDSACRAFLDAMRSVCCLEAFPGRGFVPWAETARLMAERPEFKDRVQAFLGQADFGTNGLSLASRSAALGWVAEPSVAPEIRSLRPFVEPDGSLVLREFSFAEFESKGTQKLLSLAGPMLRALETGGVLWVDDLDTHLHPHVLEALVRLFYREDWNPHGAQLLFTTHNTHLLGARVFRRDQIYAVEKDAFGVSRLNALSDFKRSGRSPRNDHDLQANYLDGRFGGVPGWLGFEPVAQEGGVL